MVNSYQKKITQFITTFKYVYDMILLPARRTRRNIVLFSTNFFLNKIAKAARPTRQQPWWIGFQQWTKETGAGGRQMMTSEVYMKVRQREGGDGLKGIRQGHKGHFPWPVHAGEVSLLATSSKVANIYHRL